MAQRGTLPRKCFLVHQRLVAERPFLPPSTSAAQSLPQRWKPTKEKVLEDRSAQAGIRIQFIRQAGTNWQKDIDFISEIIRRFLTNSDWWIELPGYPS